MEIKIRNINDMQKFMDVIDQCSGSVQVVSDRGDSLDLKSKLAQYALLTNIFHTRDVIRDLRMKFERTEDAVRVMKFMMQDAEEKDMEPVTA